MITSAPSNKQLQPSDAIQREMDTFDVLGISISVTTLESAVSYIQRWCEDNIGRFVCIRDVHGIMRAQNDRALRELHLRAAMVTADGMPLVKLGQWQGKPVSRTCGADLLEKVCAQSSEPRIKHYFYGGAEGVAEKLADVLRQRYPGIQIVGFDCPPFRPLRKDEDEAAIAKIIASKADVVWVGLSTPKQEFWMADHVDRLSATLIGVGAAYDFHTGRVKRAPKWMQQHSLEWFHRLLSEPSRLWRRYILLAPKFVFLVLMEWLKNHIASRTAPARNKKH